MLASYSFETKSKNGSGWFQTLILLCFKQFHFPSLLQTVEEKSCSFLIFPFSHLPIVQKTGHLEKMQKIHDIFYQLKYFVTLVKRLCLRCFGCSLEKARGKKYGEKHGGESAGGKKRDQFDFSCIDMKNRQFFPVNCGVVVRASRLHLEKRSGNAGKCQTYRIQI